MVGKKLGNYEIEEPLGAGGMGEVYRAHDPRLDRDVAIVESIPTGAGKWKISDGGGEQPRWRGDGRELFYWPKTEP